MSCPLAVLLSALFARLRLYGCNRNGVNYVLGFAAAREIVGRLIQALQDRANGGCTSEPLCEFVSYVARLQVWKDEHVGATRDG
jgi:hypothetical protein